jgi:hypothetical protein
LTEKARRVSRARQDREEFLKEIERIRAPAGKPPASRNPSSGLIPAKD